MGKPNQAATAYLAEAIRTLVPVFGRYPAFYG